MEQEGGSVLRGTGTMDEQCHHGYEAGIDEHRPSGKDTSNGTNNKKFKTME